MEWLQNYLNKILQEENTTIEIFEHIKSLGFNIPINEIQKNLIKLVKERKVKQKGKFYHKG